MHATTRPASGFGRELRTTAVLAGPLVAGHVATGLIGLVDGLIAGRHGTGTLAAVSVGTALFWLPIMIPMGTLMALPPTVSQLDGAGRRGEIGAVFRQAMWLAAMLGALMFALLTAAVHLLEPMGIAAEIRPGAAEFLRGIRWGVPALTLYYCMRYLSDGLHWTLPTMVLGLAGLAVLLPLGWMMLFGRFGFPEMGAAGLGYATAVMLWGQALAFALYLARSRRFADLDLFSRWELPRWVAIRELLLLGLPIGVTVGLEGGLFIVSALLIGGMGEVPVAAHQIAVNVGSITFMAALALAEATTVRVGHAVGAGNWSGVRRAVLAGYTIVILCQCVTATGIALGNELIASIYTRDAAVLALAATLLLYTAAFQISDGIQVVSGAALRGLKDTRIPMLLAAFSYWMVGMSLGAGLAFGLGWGARGIWTGLVAGLSVAALLLGLRLRRQLRFQATQA